MIQWFNYIATLKILVFGLLVGAALPALFAVATRINVAGAGVAAGGQSIAAPRRPLLITLSWAIFLLIVVVVVIAVMFIARDFLGHYCGWYMFGAKPK